MERCCGIVQHVSVHFRCKPRTFANFGIGILVLDLLPNAVKFTPEGGRITVRARVNCLRPHRDRRQQAPGGEENIS